MELFLKQWRNILISDLHIGAHISSCMKKKATLYNTSCSYSFHSRGVMGFSEHKLGVQSQEPAAQYDSS